MLVLLSGPDSYRRNKEKNRLIFGAMEKYPGLSVKVFSFEDKEDPTRQVLDFLNSRSLFSSVSLAVLDGVLSSDTSKGFIKEIVQTTSGNNSHAILIESKKPTAKSLGSLGGKIKVSEFEPLIGAAWKKFVKNEAISLGLNLKEDALNFLSGIHEGDSWWLSTELQRLSALGLKEIDLPDLNSLHTEVAQDFWPMLTIFARGRRSEKIAVLTRMLSKEPAGKIFNILAGQAVKKEPQFAVYDTLIKSGKMDYEEALVDFAIS